MSGLPALAHVPDARPPFGDVRCVEACCVCREGRGDANQSLPSAVHRKPQGHDDDVRSRSGSLLKSSSSSWQQQASTTMHTTFTTASTAAAAGNAVAAATPTITAACAAAAAAGAPAATTTTLSVSKHRSGHQCTCKGVCIRWATSLVQPTLACSISSWGLFCKQAAAYGGERSARHRTHTLPLHSGCWQCTSKRWA